MTAMFIRTPFFRGLALPDKCLRDAVIIDMGELSNMEPTNANKYMLNYSSRLTEIADYR
jgi:hypothetical protein